MNSDESDEDEGEKWWHVCLSSYSVCVFLSVCPDKENNNEEEKEVKEIYVEETKIEPRQITDN